MTADSVLCWLLFVSRCQRLRSPSVACSQLIFLRGLIVSLPCLLVFIRHMHMNCISLPKSVISASTTDSLKNKLDKFWSNQDLIYDYKAMYRYSLSNSSIYPTSGQSEISFWKLQTLLLKLKENDREKQNCLSISARPPTNMCI